MKVGSLVQIPLWVRKNLLPTRLADNDIGMFLGGVERRVLHDDVKSELEYRILIGVEIQWLYADEFEKIE